MVPAVRRIDAGGFLGEEAQSLVKHHLPDSNDGGDSPQGQAAAQPHQDGQQNQRDQRR